MSNIKLSLEGDKIYLTSLGEITKILHKTGNLYKCSNGTEYNISGHDVRDDSSKDIIAEVPKELHFEMLRVINEYHTNKEFKFIVDKNYHNRNKQIS